MNNPTCGDRIQLTMKVEDGKVKDAKFTGEGCSITMASASMMTEAIKGQDSGEALKMANFFRDDARGGLEERTIWVILKPSRRIQISGPNQMRDTCLESHGKRPVRRGKTMTKELTR